MDRGVFRISKNASFLPENREKTAFQKKKPAVSRRASACVAVQFVKKLDLYNVLS